MQMTAFQSVQRSVQQNRQSDFGEAEAPDSPDFVAAMAESRAEGE